MEGTDDLELSDQDPGSGSTQSVRKNIALKLKRSPKGRGRSKKGVRGTSSTSKKTSKKASVVNDDPVHDIGKSATAPKGSDDYDDALLRDDVLHLAVPGIKPSSSQEPIHQNQRLNWHHKVTFVGEKVVDPLIHCCEKCTLPILIYGRMIPCKHVFCFDCAKKTDSGKLCPRCKEQVVRIDQSALGTVFVCNIGGTKHGRTGCRRTYLSPRDLKAHIDHRHLKPLQEQQQARVAAAIPEYKTHSGGVVGGMDGQHAPPPPPPPQQSPHPLPHHDIYHTRHAPPVDEPRHLGHHLQPPPSQQQQQQQPPHLAAARHMSHPPPPHQPPHPPPPQQGHHPAAPHPPSPRTQATVESYQTIPVMSTSRSGNLITVPIQDEAGPYRGHPDQRPPPPQQQHPQPPPPPQPGLAYPPAQGHPPPPAAPYAPQGPPPRQQYHTAHPLPPRSSGAPPFSTPPPGPYNPAPAPHRPPQPGLPPLSMAHSHPPMSQPPPMTSSAPMGMPSHHGPPPSRQPLSHPPPPQNGPPPPQHYSSSRAHYEDQHPRTPPYLPPGGHSPRTPWGNNQPRGPPPPRVPASNTSMPPPPRADGSHYKQYYQ